MEDKRGPGFLSRYAEYAKISKQAASKQLTRVGINYKQPFDFEEADRKREAARHAGRVPYSKMIYSESPESPSDTDAVLDAINDAANNLIKDPAIAKSQAKKEEFRAKLVELEYEERVGTLVRKDEVEKESFRVGRLVRDAVLNVPARLAGILAAESDQRKVHDLLEKELRQALEALSLGDARGDLNNPEAA